MVVESGGVAQLGAAPRRRGGSRPRNNGLTVVESGGVAQLGAAPAAYGVDVDGDGRADYIVNQQEDYADQQEEQDEEEWDEEEWDEEESDYSDSHGSSAYSSDDEQVTQPTDSSSRALSTHRFQL